MSDWCCIDYNSFSSLFIGLNLATTLILVFMFPISYSWDCTLNLTSFYVLYNWDASPMGVCVNAELGGATWVLKKNGMFKASNSIWLIWSMDGLDSDFWATYWLDFEVITCTLVKEFCFEDWLESMRMLHPLLKTSLLQDFILYWKTSEGVFETTGKVPIRPFSIDISFNRTGLLVDCAGL